MTKRKMNNAVILFTAMLILVAALFSGCKGKTENSAQAGGIAVASSKRALVPAAFSDLDQSFPLEEKATLKIFRLAFPYVHPASGDLWMWKRYEELTNVHIEWEDVTPDNISERRNLLMASNDLPDIFDGARFSMGEVATYGAGGSFVRLNELIEKNNPHLKAVMERWPVVKQAMTMPDGNIYSLPWIQPDPLDASIRYYINKNWLARLGLEVPKTVDELTYVLEQFKLKDANGNGNPNDEFPWCHQSGNGNWTTESQLFGSFGGGNKGQQAIGMGIDLGSDGKVRYLRTSDIQRNVWKVLADWYKKGIIGEGYFSGIDEAQWVTYGEQDRVGLFSWVEPAPIGGQTMNNFVGINVLEGPGGDKLLSWCEPPVRTASAFMVTSACKNPDLAMKWIDFFYCDQGTIFGQFGENGVTFNYNAEGYPVCIDEILNSKDGTRVASFQWVDNVYGGYYPYLDIDVERRLIAWNSSVEYELKTTEDINQYVPEGGYWAAFLGTPEEAEDLAMLSTDLSAYVDEMRPKFITGELNLDRDFDAYVTRMKQMGADKYIEIRQKQLDRMMAQR